MSWPRGLLLCIVAAFALAACGGDDEPTTAEWAEGVCSATSTWTEAIAQTPDEIRRAITESGSVDEVFEELRAATETFAEDLESLEGPDTDAGEEARDLLDELAADLRSEIETIEGAFDDADDATELIEAATTAVTAFAAIGERVSTTFEQLGELDAQGELERAFEDAESCQELESR